MLPCQWTHLNAARFLPETHETRLKYHLVTAELPFTVKTLTVCTRQDPRKAAWHPAVCNPHAWCLPSLSLCQSLGQEWELFFIKHAVKVNGHCCWDILLSQQILDAIIASFIATLSVSKTVHWCILRSTQSNCCSARLWTSLSQELQPHNTAGLNSTDYEI